MARAEELIARHQKKMEAYYTEQLDTILEKIDVALEQGKRSVLFKEIMCDIVRERLQSEGFFIVTIVENSYPCYEISW